MAINGAEMFKQAADLFKAGWLPIGATAVGLGLLPEIAAGLTGRDSLSAGFIGISSVLTLLSTLLVTLYGLNLAQGLSAWTTQTNETFNTKFTAGLGLSIVFGLGVLAGLLLLIVPGLILWAMWFVVLPVLLHEGTGVFAAFSRSRALTKGHRGTLAGMIIVFLIAMVLLTVVMGVIAPVDAQGNIPALSVFNLLFVALFSLIGAYFTLVSVAVYRALVQAEPTGEQAQ
jgi:hypothetical protein